MTFGNELIGCLLGLRESRLGLRSTHPRGLLFGSDLFTLVVGYGDGCGVVNSNWRGRLWVSKFMKNSTNIDGFLAIVKEGSNFGSSCGGKYWPENFP